MSNLISALFELGLLAIIFAQYQENKYLRRALAQARGARDNRRRVFRLHKGGA